MATRSNVNAFKFNKGLVTEQSLLGAEIGSSVDESNLRIAVDGVRERRLGINLERGGSVISTGLNDDREELPVTYHDWPSPDGNSLLHIGVAQVGQLLYFMDMTKPNPSANLLNGGNPLSLPLLNEATVSSDSINGYLVLNSSGLNKPAALSYDTDTKMVSRIDIDIKIRDFVGVDDSLAIDERPTVLTANHKYNLENQGWTDNIFSKGIEIREVHEIFCRDIGKHNGTAIIGGYNVFMDNKYTGALVAGAIVSVINNQILDGCFYPCSARVVRGDFVEISYDLREKNPPRPVSIGNLNSLKGKNEPNMYSRVVTIGVYGYGGSVLSEIYNKYGVYPSNSDTWVLGQITDLFDDSVRKFDVDVWYKNSKYINREAPKGHFIINPFSDSLPVSDVTEGLYFTNPSPNDDLVFDVPIPQLNEGGATGVFQRSKELGRTSLVTTYAGRVFYAGVNSKIENKDKKSLSTANTIFFSKIVENRDDFGKCYQKNDPTDIDFNELEPDDGGTLQIIDAVDIRTLVTYESSLLVFSSNGVWEINGGGETFSASRMMVQKIAHIGIHAPRSVVVVDDGMYYWAEDGIYKLARNQYGRWEVGGISQTTIQGYYNSIPKDKKRVAVGYLDKTKNQARWILGTYNDDGIGADSIIPYEVSLDLTLSAKDIVSMVKMTDTIYILAPFSLSETGSSWRYVVLDTKAETIQENTWTADTDNSFSCSPMVRVNDEHYLVAWNPQNNLININCMNYKTNMGISNTGYHLLFGYTVSNVSFIHMKSLGGNLYVIFYQGGGSSFVLHAGVFSFTIEGGYTQIRNDQTLSIGVNLTHVDQLSPTEFIVGNASVYKWWARWDGTSFVFSQKYASGPTLPPSISGQSNSVQGVWQSEVDPLTFYTYKMYSGGIIISRLNFVSGNWVVDNTFLQEITLSTTGIQHIRIQEITGKVLVIISRSLSNTSSTPGAEFVKVDNEGKKMHTSVQTSLLHKDPILITEGTDSGGIVGKPPYSLPLMKVDKDKYAILSSFYRNTSHSYNTCRLTVRNFV